MGKSLRLTEKWMRRGLRLVAVVFASFLIGLGSTVAGDLLKVEKQLSLARCPVISETLPLSCLCAYIQRRVLSAHLGTELTRIKRFLC